MTGLLDLQFSADEISEIHKIFSKNDTKCLKNGRYSMLILIREKTSEKAIQGCLFLNDTFICYTLENAAKAIPTGGYNIENSKSPKFNRELPLLYNKNVPAKRGIRIHVGNDAVKDSSGCILVGMDRNGEKLAESTSAETMVTMLCRNVKKLFIVDAVQ